MPALKNMLGLLEQLQSEYITVHQHRCVVVRNRNASCRRCADACTSTAIALADGEISISPERCVGCGTCATVCPTGALSATHPNDAELLKGCLAVLTAADNDMIIACEQVLAVDSEAFDPEKLAAVVCLGRVDESLLCALATAGATSIHLVCGDCEACELKVGRQTAELVQQTTNTLLQAWGQDLRIELTDTLPEQATAGSGPGYDASRRAFFANFGRQAREVAASAATSALEEQLGAEKPPEPKFLKVMSDGTLPHFVPDRRERLLDYLTAMGQPKTETIVTRLWGHVLIDLRICSACQMCATFCPTAAITKLIDEDGSVTLEHYPGDCVKCRCCEDICPTDALTLDDAVAAHALLDGTVESYELQLPEVKAGSPQSIVGAMKKLLNVDQIYER
ncbi:MAG: 4Fe-4S binding protein [Coriobacteriales bacterium]|jgi:formate hydrogenlyase subunit 6/NADH:ubiquinone oxidoreductase subunit I|nr:4Fe-4S binding protein [Coriobacteriales bacterium]